MNQRLLQMLVLIITYFFVLLYNADALAGCSIMSSGTTEHLNGVWGSSGSDVFAVGGTILHYDGSSWSSMESGFIGTFISIWGISGSDVFAITNPGLPSVTCIYHYDGSEWAEMSCDSVSLKDIWAISSTGIFTVGNDYDLLVSWRWGYFLQYDGTAWNPVISDFPEFPIILGLPLFSIWGISGTDIFLGGYHGMHHYVGTSDLIFIPCDGASSYIKDIWGSSGTDVFALGPEGTIFHFNGDSDSDGILDEQDICPYDPDNDLDGDNICGDIDNCPNTSNTDQADADEDDIGNVCDNCMEDYNPNQLDTYPPQGNGIGNTCDCECDFNCDGNVDASDVAAFLTDFGRSTFNNPCTNGSTCNGDVNCDGNVDALDVNKFLEDFGRSQFNNPCPACVAGAWCVYP